MSTWAIKWYLHSMAANPSSVLDAGVFGRSIDDIEDQSCHLAILFTANQSIFGKNLFKSAAIAFRSIAK